MNLNNNYKLRSHQTMWSFCLEKNMKMIHTSYGYMTSMEAKIIGNIYREEKEKKLNDRKNTNKLLRYNSRTI